MNPVTVIWSAAAGACLTLALVHLLLWCWNRRLMASLWFCGVALSVAAMVGIESAILRVHEPAEFYQLHRWGYISFFLTFLCVVGFIQSYFRTGRWWLIWSMVGLRLLILFLAYVPGPTFNIREVSEMIPASFLGDTVMLPRSTPQPWEWLGNLSGLLLVVFVVDSARQLWRTGDGRDRQRAWVVTAVVLLFVLSCVINGLLIHQLNLALPYYITLSFLFVIVAMEIELSRDLFHASHLANEVRENSESMRLAAGAGQLALWRWDFSNDNIWVSPNGRGLYGIPPGESVTLEALIIMVPAVGRADNEPT